MFAMASLAGASIILVKQTCAVFNLAFANSFLLTRKASIIAAEDPLVCRSYLLDLIHSGAGRRQLDCSLAFH